MVSPADMVLLVKVTELPVLPVGRGREKLLSRACEEIRQCFLEGSEAGS